MKCAVLILLVAGITPVFAQNAKPKAAPVDPSTAFAIAEPDENSPFFLDTQNASRVRNTDYSGSEVKSSTSEFPQNRNAADSAANQVKDFFGGMFSSVHFGPKTTATTTVKLQVDPDKFSLQDRREVNVTYSIRNNTKNMTRLEYPTSQRIEILTYDSKGAVIDRWSDDHAFQPEEGIVVINPKERIEYQEKFRRGR